MTLINDRLEINLKNSKKTKMTYYKGRAWDIIGITSVGNINIEVYADTTWGKMLI